MEDRYEVSIGAKRGKDTVMPKPETPTCEIEYPKTKEVDEDEGKVEGMIEEVGEEMMDFDQMSKHSNLIHSTLNEQLKMQRTLLCKNCLAMLCTYVAIKMCMNQVSLIQSILPIQQCTIEQFLFTSFIVVL